MAESIVVGESRNIIAVPLDQSDVERAIDGVVSWAVAPFDAAVVTPTGDLTATVQALVATAFSVSAVADADLGPGTRTINGQIDYVASDPIPQAVRLDVRPA